MCQGGVLNLYFENDHDMSSLSLSCMIGRLGDNRRRMEFICCHVTRRGSRQYQPSRELKEATSVLSDVLYTQRTQWVASMRNTLSSE